MSRRFWHRLAATAKHAWIAFATATATFLEECILRVGLAFNILVGRVPQRTNKRPWVRSAETPVLVDCYDFTNDRQLFSILVWPPLESSREDAIYDHYQRVEGVLDAIAKGTEEKVWSMQWVVDYDLRWDPSRRVWVDGDDHRYDGARFGAELLRRRS